VTEDWPVATHLVDPAALARWMDERGLGTGHPIVDAELLVGGTQNILLRFARSDRGYVLRRPPEHKRDNSDETMRREARVLAAIAASDVPHPRFIAGEIGVEVLGSTFYLMEPVDGFAPGAGLPQLHASDPDIRRRMGLAMADGIAALGRVDHDAVGLADFGRPGYLERQVPRWRAHLDSYSRFDGYGEPDIPAVDEVGEWLEERRPSTWTPGILHGDFHYNNVLFDRDGPTLLAIVDWELATIGDPLVDLGQLIATSPKPGDDGVVGFGPADGLPSPAELVEHYAVGSDRDVSNIDWYTVLACYRLGIILEGTNARAAAGRAPREIGDQLHATTVALFEQAAELISV